MRVLGTWWEVLCFYNIQYMILWSHWSYLFSNHAGNCRQHYIRLDSISQMGLIIRNVIIQVCKIVIYSTLSDWWSLTKFEESTVINFTKVRHVLKSTFFDLITLSSNPNPQKLKSTNYLRSNVLWIYTIALTIEVIERKKNNKKSGKGARETSSSSINWCNNF